MSKPTVVKVRERQTRVIVRAPGPQGPPGPPGSGNTIVNAGDGLSASGAGTVQNPLVLAVDGTVIRTANAANHNHDASAINAGTLPLARGGTGQTTWATSSLPIGHYGLVAIARNGTAFTLGSGPTLDANGALVTGDLQTDTLTATGLVSIETLEASDIDVSNTLRRGGVDVVLSNEARLPAQSGTTGHVWTKTAGGFAWQAPSGGGSGTVTSVALTMPGIFSVGGSPITGSGTLAVTLANQSAGLVLAGPTSGAAAAPTFRALALTDLPAGTSAGEVITWGGTAWAAQQLSHASLSGLLVDNHTQYLHLDPASLGRNEVQPAGNVPALELVAPAGGYSATTTLFRVSTHDGTHLFRAHRNHGAGTWELTFSQRPTIGGSQIALVSDLIGLDNGGTGQGDWGSLEGFLPASTYGFVSLEKGGSLMSFAQGIWHDGAGVMTVSGLEANEISVGGEPVVTDGAALRGARHIIVRAATTANITLSGTQTIDGQALAVNDLVLVINQTTGSQNGVYLVQAGAWVRTLMVDTQQMRERLVVVTAGTTNGGSIWQCVTSNPTVGSTATQWSRVNSSRLRFASNGQTNLEHLVLNGGGETIAFPGTVNYYVYQVTNTNRVVLSNDTANASTTGLIFAVQNGTSFGSGGTVTFGLHAPSGGVRRRVVTGTSSTNSAMGRVSLSSGTVTVSNTYVATGDLIRVTRLTVSGTAGHLSPGTITAGTSFVLNSTEASDAGEVLWEIIRPA